jgi:oligosaccharyltransferase complex subunit beta
MIMKWPLSFLVLAIAAVVRAASFTGNRLLVVLDEQAEREKYSVFLEDLAGKCNYFHTQGTGSSGLMLEMVVDSGKPPLPTVAIEQLGAA